jgi:C1A family cysteine protease
MTTPQLARRTVKGLGWKPDLPDARDYVFSAVRGAKPPPHVDLRTSNFMPPVWDQLDEGSCTAQGVGCALAFAHEQAGHRAFMPSRQWIYRAERVMEGGDPAEDSGAMIRDGMKVIATIGAPRETLLPYTPENFNVEPTKALFADAKKHRALKYQRVTSQTSCIAALAAGRPVVFGFTVYSSFVSGAIAAAGVVSMPDLKTESVLGGHAVLAVGYDLPKKVLIVRNSWGKSWGDHGYFTMPFAYAFDTNLADDFWTITVAS